MGSFPHELPGYRHISNEHVRAEFERAWGVTLQPDPGLRIPNMFEAALDGSFKALYCQGEDIAQSDPNTQHVTAALLAMECVVVQDIFLNETAKFAHVFLPGSSFLEKDGTFTNAERRISRVRKVMEPLAGKADWEATIALANALGYPMNYRHPSEIMDEIARLTPTFRRVSYADIDRHGSLQWPCNDTAPDGTPTMHIDQFVRGKGRFMLTGYVPTDEKVNNRYPLLLTTGRILSQYNVGAQTRRTANVAWHDADRLEIHPTDAESRGIQDGDWVGIGSRAGQTVLRAKVSARVAPGVVYTTFHFPESGANVITTDNSDWATNCPEYKVTAVEVVKVFQPSQWQKRYQDFSDKQRRLLQERRTAEQARCADEQRQPGQDGQPDCPLLRQRTRPGAGGTGGAPAYAKLLDAGHAPTAGAMDRGQCRGRAGPEGAGGDAVAGLRGPCRRGLSRRKAAPTRGAPIVPIASARANSAR